MNRWYQQLFKRVEASTDLARLKISEETFSENYQGDFSVRDAIPDLEVLATINTKNRAQARLVKIARDPKNYSIKLFTLKDSIPLSQSMPIFESMGLEVLIGRPYRIRLGNRNYWINHFTLGNGASICDVNVEKIPRYFSELFESIWRQRSENDAFNHLLFSACIKAENIQILRAYTAYLQQIRFPHSREYIIETLNSYNVKKIITACPHCLNTLKHEYPPLGGDYEVIHHAEFIDQLVKAGKIKLKQSLAGALTYHDPCYLGRYSNIFDQPRSILRSVSKGGLRELERHGRESFCCGAGGGRMWMEETIGKRIYLERSEEIVRQQVSNVAVGCPFCMTMIEDGMKELEKEEEIKIMDIAELVAKDMA